MIGTWDRAYPHDPEGPPCVEPQWLDELLAWLAPVHRELGGLRRERVRFVHAGLLPLARTGGPLLGTAQVRTAPDGTIEVIGVKYTTALLVAERVMRALDAALGGPPPVAAREMPLLDHAETLRRFEAGAGPRKERVAPGCEVTRGQVEHAIRHERARTLADVMLRRTAVATAGHPGPRATNAIAGEISRVLSWTEGRLAEELRSFDDDWRFAGNVPRQGSPE
jgi:glycerol-3-phosphate dehydrogenase